MLTGGLTWTAGGGGAPLLFGNVARIIACERKREVSTAFRVSPSTACKWEEFERIPLRYLAPFLSIMTWETLCGPGIEDTIHAGRGYTHDAALACRNGADEGPVLLRFGSEIDEVMARIRIIVGSGGYKEIGRGVNTDGNQVATWVKRRKIPDNVYHRISRQYKVSLSWLLTGSGVGSPEGGAVGVGTPTPRG